MTPEQNAALRKPFDPKSIGKLPKGGAQLDFVGHAAVTDRLLAVDAEWTWEPFATDEQGLPAYQNGCLWIRLTVCGVTRVGVGDGPDPKQRIGDAIRNAAMRFGVALDLWSRQELQGVDPNGGDAAQRPRSAEQYRDKHPEPTSEPAAGHSAEVPPPPLAHPEQSLSPAPADPVEAGDLTDLTVITEVQVSELRDRVIEALKQSKREASKILAHLQVEAARRKMMQQPTFSPLGEPMTVAALLDGAAKHLARKDNADD